MLGQCRGWHDEWDDPTMVSHLTGLMSQRNGLIQRGPPCLTAGDVVFQPEAAPTLEPMVNHLVAVSLLPRVFVIELRWSNCHGHEFLSYLVLKLYPS